MHTCPDCGQACYCHGDIDDSEVETEAYSSANCTCCDDSPIDDEPLDDGPEGAVLTYCALCDCLHEDADHRRTKPHA
jgi:hypothetical protein